MKNGRAKIKAKPYGKRAAVDGTAEVNCLTANYGITPIQAKNLLARFGADRVGLDAAAQRLKVPSH